MDCEVVIRRGRKGKDMIEVHTRDDPRATIAGLICTYIICKRSIIDGEDKSLLLREDLHVKQRLYKQNANP
jgi:hypothetical protein